MNLLKRTSIITLFLIFILILKSILSILLRSLIVSHFGAGTETDAYFAAFSIPQQLSDFFIGGILFAAIIPVFQKRRVEIGNDNSASEMSALINISSLILIIFSVIYVIFTPYIIKLVFSGFEPQKQKLTITYARFFSPLILLFGLSLIYSSIYHSFRDFFIPSLATLMYPTSSIISLYLLPPVLGIERLIYGNLVGAILGIIFLIVFINKKVPLKWSFQYHNPLISSVFNLSLPVLVENLFLKLAVFIKNRIISILPINGALTMIELNLFIVHSLAIFISGPISTAIFPLLGHQEANKKREELVATLQKTLNIIFFLAVPFNVFILFEAENLIRLLFGYGKFTDFECITTTKLVIITSFVIIPNCIQSLTGRMFYILEYTKVPSFISSIIMMIGVVLCYWGATRFGIYGFMTVATIGTCVGAILNLLILLVLLKWNLNLSLLISPFKSLMAAIFMAIVLITTSRIFKTYDISSFIYTVIVSAISFISYILACLLLRHEDLKYLFNTLLKQFANE